MNGMNFDILVRNLNTTAFDQVERGFLDVATASQRAVTNIVSDWNMAEGSLERIGQESRQAAASLTEVGRAFNVQATAVAANNNAMVRHATGARAAAAAQKNLVFQLNDVAVSLASGMNPMMVAIQQGSQIATIYGPSEGGIGRAFRETGKLIGGMVSKVPVLIAGFAGVAAVVAGLRYEIDKTTERSITIGDVIGGVMKTIGDKIAEEVRPAIAALSPYVNAVWDTIVAGAKFTGNTIVRAFAIAFETVKITWTQFPNAISAAVVGAANLTLTGVESMVNGAIYLLNQLSAQANVVLERMGSKISLPKLGDVDLFSISNPFDDRMMAGIKDFGANVQEIAGTDYMGALYENIRRNTIEVSALGDKADSTGDKLKKTARGWDGVKTGMLAANDNLAAARGLFQGFVGDLRSGMQAGQSFWESLANAAQTALDKVLDKLLEVAADSLFNSLFAGNPFLKGGNVPGYFGKSGYTNTLAYGGPRAQGGPVNSGMAYLVGENGPEIFAPDRSGSILGAGSGGAANVNIQIINNGGAQVSTQGSGTVGDPLRLIIDAAKADIKSDMARGGFDKPMARYGAQPQRKAR